MLDELIAEAEVGEAAQALLDSDLGKVLIGMAKQEVALAQEQLATVTPTDVDKIRELQTQAWRGSTFEQWLIELVNKGENALQIYKQQKAS